MTTVRIEIIYYTSQSQPTLDYGDTLEKKLYKLLEEQHCGYANNIEYLDIKSKED